MKYLDYIYYRCARFFMKRDGLPGQRAIMTVSLIVAMLIIDMFGVIYQTFFEDYSSVYLKEDGVIVVITVSLFIMFLFYLRYRKRYPLLKKRWSNETKQQKTTRGVLVIFVIAFPIVFLIVYLNLIV